MKELEKTKRISIAAVLFILIIIIGLLFYERPKHIYTVNTSHMLEKVINADYFIALDKIDNPNFILIDIRSPFEFEKGHINGAINISTPELLKGDNPELFKKIANNKKFAVLYGKNPTDANNSFMVLYQLGFENIKILLASLEYEQNKLITKNSVIEKNVTDINTFITESQKKVKIAPKPKKIVPKKIITVKKKKKMPVEGGC